MGRQSPDDIRFLTYTTRYNRDYWVTLDGLEKHYRARRNRREALRRPRAVRHHDEESRRAWCCGRPSTRPPSTSTAKSCGSKPAPEMAFEKSAGTWKPASLHDKTLRKKHGLQGPIDDAFLEPFLVVRPTGTPWNAAANDQALRILQRFERQYTLAYRGHVRVKNDKDVTAADFAKYHLVLFGDPGSNRWIAKLNGKLPLHWTRETVALGSKSFPAAEFRPGDDLSESAERRTITWSSIAGSPRHGRTGPAISRRRAMAISPSSRSKMVPTIRTPLTPASSTSSGS